MTQKELESIGFVKAIKNQWIGWQDYSSGDVNAEYAYFLYVTIHVPLMGDLYKIILHRYLNNETNIEEKLEEYESEVVFKGKIEDLEELKRTLIQLDIWKKE